MTKTLARVTCVDDDSDILEVAKLCLETIGGYDVITCAAPLEALTCIRDHRADIVLLDVMMPGMDGPAVYMKMCEDPELKKIPVIFMTARVQPREVEEYLVLGAVAVIAKPFDPMQLATQVQEAWEKHQVTT